MTSKAEPSRLRELEAVRGIACLIVAIAHHLFVFPAIADKNCHGGGWFPHLIINSPLRIFLGAYESVIVFFVISGFVLSLPFYDAQRSPTYLKFMIRRVLRIWPPYMVAVLVAALGYFAVYHKQELTGLSFTATHFWWHPTGPKQILHHMNLLGVFDSRAFDPVIWSLVHEMRIYLVFPLLMLIVLNIDWYVVVPCTFFLLYLGSPQVAVLQPIEISRTLAFVPVFFVGAYLAKHRAAITGYLSKAGIGIQLAALAFVIFFYPYRTVLRHVDALHTNFMDITMPAVTGTIMVVFALSSAKFGAFLRQKWLLYLGEISYSVYLYHLIVLLVFLYAFYGKVSLPILLVSSFLTGLSIAALSHKLVELPSIKLGHYLSNFFQKPRVPDTFVPPQSVPPPAQEMAAAGSKSKEAS